MHLHTISQHNSTIACFVLVFYFVCHTNLHPTPGTTLPHIITYNDTFAGGTIVFFVYTFYSNNLLKWSNSLKNYRLRLLRMFKRHILWKKASECAGFRHDSVFFRKEILSTFWFGSCVWKHSVLPVLPSIHHVSDRQTG